MRELANWVGTFTGELKWSTIEGIRKQVNMLQRVDGVEWGRFYFYSFTPETYVITDAFICFIGIS